MPEFECSICKRNFQTEESLNQHNAAKHSHENRKKKPVNYRGYVIFSLVIIIIILLPLTVYSYMKKPGQYDEFAQCLTSTGAVIYGNDFCQYTAKQLNFFGKSKKYLNYIRCAENQELCDEKKISITPTWQINGEMYEQVQTLEKLSLLSGCEI